MSAFVCAACGHTMTLGCGQPSDQGICPACGHRAASSVEATHPNGQELATLPPASQPAADGPATAGVPPSLLPPAGWCPAVPGYEILGELGRGGMGVVYKARQVKLNRVVALKMILAGGHAGEADLARFRTEAEAIARLQHPNIVQIHEVGEHEGKPFFSLEFCPGGSLEKRLDGTPLPPQDAARLVQALAGAMHAAHNANVIHRDLKPANVLLTADGTPKVTDFGLAKMLDEGGNPTVSGAVLGTPSYMAPEQASGKNKAVGPPADIHALGAILYELLTGRPPFKAATHLDTILQVVSDEPVPPTQLQPKTPRDLETICLKCLEKEPGKRYGSAEALADDLRRFLEGDPVRARPLGEWESAVRWAKKYPITAALTVLMVIGTLLLQLFYTAMSFTAVPEGPGGFGTTVLAFAAWLAGFLATMAILVQPRRWVVLGVVLFLLVTLGLPCAAREYLQGAGRAGTVETLVEGVPNILFVALGLVGGVFAAGVFGGMSRWIAQRRQTDMLTVFFGGLLGATFLMMVTSCLIQLPLMLFGGDETSWLYLGLTFLSVCIGSVVGFWLGGTFVASFTRRRLKPE
jgi:tRNA A-37 threonylcarbamoyl transferase component Bud32